MRRWLLLLTVIGVAGATQSAHAACPDGVLDGAEECDDGNMTNGDGCSAACTIEPWILDVCSTSRDGSVTLATPTIVNTYFPAPMAEHTLAIGTTSLTLGTPSDGPSTPVTAGDRLLIIQMQGAAINAGAALAANGPYGDGPGGLDRIGALANTVRAGTYELVLAVADTAGGVVAIRGDGPNNGLVNQYVNSRAISATQGFQTYQIVRIPQYDNMTLMGPNGSVIASPWNGRTGGIAFVDVANTLTFIDGGSIDVTGRGFRGGQALTSANGAFDMPGFPGMKGEGTAGSPRLLYSSIGGQLVNGLVSGYPAPADEGPGAPGNAGGNARQSDDSAGGGGANGGAGGIGGRGGGANANNRGNSGRGGAAYRSTTGVPANADRLAMGGGGGGASGDDPFPTTAAPGSGRNGGGIVIIRSAKVAAMGNGNAVIANGHAGVTASAEGGGGGGAGGSVLVYTDGADLGALALQAQGGNGNNMLEPQDGGGGGGGGGFVYRIDSTGGAPSVVGGAGGTAVTMGQYIGVAGTAGFSETAMMPPATLACEFDRDTDGDGVLDRDDKCPGGDDTDDHDGDGVPDACDLDDDNDGIPDTAESGGADPSADSDGDLVSDFEDPDAPGFVDQNGDGIDDRYDLDGDGVPNHLDPDSDGDGLLDIVEGGGTDADHDGKIDDFTDANGDGLDDDTAGTPLPLPDHDEDGAPDFLDVDDDNDGILTQYEAPDANANGSPDDARDSDGDGTPDYLDIDDDGDGIETQYEAPDTNANGMPEDARDTDGDGIPDYLDTDDDGDGVDTAHENPDTNANGMPEDAQDTDGDGTPDYLDTDDDGDGIDTQYEHPDANADGDPADAQDTDGDGTPDYLDPDDDGDGINTADEHPDPNGDGNPDDAQDSDGDGTPDYLDPKKPNDPNDPNGPGGPFGYAGGACSTTSSGGVSTWFVLLVAIGGLGALRRRSRSRRAVTGLAGAAAAASLALPTAARAEIDLDRYAAPGYIDDGLVLSRPAYPGHLRGGLALRLEYANDPLVIEQMLGDKDTETLAVVANHLVGHLGGHLGIGRRGLAFVTLPIHLAMSGDSVMSGASADGAGIGDPTVGGRYGLVRGERFGLALQAALSLPLATATTTTSFGGSSSVTFAPSLLAEIGRASSVRVNLQVGLRLREEQPLGNTTNGSELTFGAGLAVPLYAQRTVVTGHAEVYGATGLSEFGSREETPLEALLGIKSRFASGLSLGLAGGPGFRRGIGSPDYRLLAMLGWAMPDEKPAPPPVRPMIVDSDGDGLLDPDDKCPKEPEDKDGFEDADGCPDPDNDQDGVPDVADGAPLEPEDKDGFEDGDGVPDPDNDKDTIADAADQCPNEPEDMDSFRDEDGCPDLDNDNDTVADAIDECPTAPGKPENKGCPVAVRIDNTAGRILILKKVEFATNKDIILTRSFPLLEEVAATILANPQLKRIRVEGHTDSVGADRYNLDLSRRRARSVMRWLADEKKIDAARLEAFGCGENLPISSNATNAGRQDNRRVEFHIADPAPPAGDTRDLSKCELAP